MDLKGEKKETKCTRKKSPGKKVFPWSEEKNRARREDGEGSSSKTELCKTGRRIFLFEFDEGVEDAPGICNLIFPKSALKRKYSVETLKKNRISSREKKREKNKCKCKESRTRY